MTHTEHRELRFLAVLALWAYIGSSGAPASAQDSPNANSAKGDERLARTGSSQGSPHEAGSGDNYALLIGVNNYSYTAPLRYCVRDMQAYKEVLTKHGGYRPENIHLLVDTARGQRHLPTRGNIYNRLKRLCNQAQPEDTILVGFSGHGELDDEGYAYLMPSDGALDSLDITGLSVAGMHKLLRSCKARQKILIIDACHAAGKKSSSRFDLQNVPVPQGEGFVELLSCRADEISWEDDEKQHGLFSYYLVDAIRNGRADQGSDGNSDGYVSVQEAITYVRKQLHSHFRKNPKFTGRKQTPVVRAKEQSGPVFLARLTNQVPGDIPAGDIPPDGELLSAGPAVVELLTLPGLAGQWWFDEMPWLTPQVRVRLAKAPQIAELLRKRHVVAKPIDGSLPDGAGGLITNPDVNEIHNQLKQAFRQYVSSNEASFRQRRALQRLSEVRWDRVVEGEGNFILRHVSHLDDPHLVALVHHKLGGKEAEAAYQEALQNYDVAASGTARLGEVPLGLHALCWADMGWWQFSTGRYRPAVNSFQEARAILELDKLDAPLFEIVCLSREARAHRKLGEWALVNDRVKEAFKRAEEHLDENHPLMAYLHERRAWALMDQWRCKEAQDDFSAALRLRRAALESSVNADREWMQISCFHNEHGLAMAKRFAGQEQESQEAYSRLRNAIVEEIESDMGGEITPPYAVRLENTMQRLADTYLFAANPRAKRALRTLQDAYGITDYLAPDVRSVVRGQSLAKQAIAAALLGRIDQVQEIFQALDRLDLSDAQRERLQLYRDVAAPMGGLVSADSQQVEKSRNALRDILLHFTEDRPSEGSEEGSAYNSVESRDTLRRELLELLLLGWSELLRSHQEEAAAESSQRKLQEDAAILFALIPRRFLTPPKPASSDETTGNEAKPDVPPILGFLRPYYDLALEAELETLPPGKIHQAMKHVKLAATGSHFYLRPHDPVLVCHFTPTRGYALLSVPEAEGEIFLLDVGRQDLERGDQVSLPQGLLERLKTIDQHATLVWQHDLPVPERLPEELQVVHGF